MSLTFTYITSREEPRFEWWFDSLRAQARHEDGIKIIVVDLRMEEPGRRETVKKLGKGFPLWHVEPMPNVWQGKHRITKCDWWSIATAKNTGICLCTTDFIVFCDDRSALGDRYLEAVREAQKARYVVAGAYRKVANLVVENGKIKDFTNLADGVDHRCAKGHPDRAVKCKGSSVFGCTQGLPLEWALAVNGFDETCNGVGLEDTMFGSMLENSGYPRYFDMRMMLWEDRTNGQLGKAPVRKDKGVSPNDKSHALLYRLIHQKRATHNRDLASIRSDILKGGPWPIPKTPEVDWYDNELLSQMDPPV